MIVLTYQVNNLTEIIVKIHRLLFEAFNPLPLPRINAMYLDLCTSIIPEAEQASASAEHLVNDAHDRGSFPELPVLVGIYFNANQGQQFSFPLVPELTLV